MDQEIILNRIQRADLAYAEIILNRADKGNALTRPMLQVLDSHLRIIEDDRSLRAVVLRGRGRCFCTGGDIGAWGGLNARQMADEWIKPGIEIFSRLANLPQPVVAVISGPALGGGLELSLAADFRIAVQSAKFATPEVGLGMIAGWGGVRRLAEMIGVARAGQMTLSGAPIEAEKALHWGLIDSVAPDLAALDEELTALLDRLFANSPLAMAATKRLLATMHADFSEEHAVAAGGLMGTGDCQEGVRAFREKRQPTFLNR